MKMITRLLAATLLSAGFAAAAEAKTLVYCSEGSPENFNPQINTTGTSFDAARPVFNQLVEFERGTTNVIPGLAESWEVSADGLEVTFHLRKGVKFHSSKSFTPTRDFNADDVLFSFDRMWKADDPYHNVSGGAYDYFNDMGMPDLLKAIEKVDDYTVKFTLARPESPFLANLAMDFATIHSAEYAAAMLKAGTPEKVDQEPVGTGPFTFIAYQKDAVIRFKAFADYWGGKAAIDDLVFAITPDPTTRYAKLAKGECHVMLQPNPADLETIKQNGDVELLSQPGLNIGYLAFNVTKKPFDDKRVRLAITHAIDKDTILRDVYQGAGQPAKNFIPPTIWSYNDAVEPYAYDVDKAKELLKEAGLEGGFETDLWWMPVTRPYNPNAKRIAEIVQADLAKLNIKAELKSYEWGEYRKRLQAGEHQMGQLGWTGDNGDPDNFFFLLGCDAARPGGQNLSKWCDPSFDEKLKEARKLTDKAARTKLYEEMQEIVHDEVPVYTIAHSVVFEPVRKEVKGYKVSPLGRHEFYGVDLD
ncbi:dipeptide transport system substrate-binding protein [Prosthecomicrobium pneumaticum]|uniref:Dipeptide transport system substrate-binding protein n=2 Tax=Prosthecomicrobium pneumaticum TaxID=81895 RepID=A0A7W9FL78_9HYPH|nr:ABC transporter substrate-binding protein [Prosthecomicrobium pneumaticum]MBB5752399.1 dipeptide transport system substrate-binding protein [Prosthecomicrobium pneumaticum]